jgi:hypothetical protein
MNVFRTIQRQEDPRWVQLLFKGGPHTAFDPSGRVPFDPPVFPFAGKFHKPVVGDYLYVVYKGEIIGYGIIDSLHPHYGTDVGIDGEPVTEGEEGFLAGPLTKMPFLLACRGFTGRRYVEKALHSLPLADAQAVIAELGLLA